MNRDINRLNNEYILEMEGICKSFSSVKALDNVELKVRKGTVHALMGENGAGKSTIMKILLGLYHADAGTVAFKGRHVSYRSPQDALEDGIAMIHQELANIPERLVSDNIFLGRELKHGKSPFINRKGMAQQTREIFKKLDIEIDPYAKMGELSVARQQLCEIAKAVSYDADLIIMDEPTSAITDKEVDVLFRIINDLRDQGIAIIYITHKMDEVFQIADEITVLRDGQYVDCFAAKDVDQDQLISKMVGRELTQMFPKAQVDIGDVVFSVENLSRPGEFEDISFEVRSGEILGVAGLMGAGRSEVMETVFGIRKKKSGVIKIDGKEVKINSPADAIKNHIAFLTEDRKRSGCFLPLSLRMNIYAASIDKQGNTPFLNTRVTKENANKMMEALNIKASSIEQIMMELSGGNQQKVLLGRWLLTDPKIIIVDEPTRGIDVGSKAMVHELLGSLAKQGVAIIMVSSEMPEIIGMSDRIMVMSEGCIKAVLDRSEATQERILSFATVTV